MQDKNIKKNSEPEEEINPQMQEALAAYFEARNGGQVSKTPTEWLSVAQLAEWQQAQALLEIPGRALETRPSVEMAWQSFRSRSFAVTPDSLGNYVTNALAQAEQTTLKESGLSKATLEALRADPTPIEKLKNYELDDYAALARRYEVKDSTFPRMLKWLKALGKSLTLPTTGSTRGMVFAREDEPRQGLSEAELLASLPPLSDGDEGDDEE